MKRAVVFLVMFALTAIAHSAAVAQSGVTGAWQGTMTLARQTVRIGLVLTQQGSGYGASLVLIDQDGATVPAQQVTLTGNALHLAVPALGVTYEGTLNAAATEITGAFLQQNVPNALTFKRVAALDPPSAFDQQARTAVAMTVNNYFAAFSRKDYEALGNMTTVPFVRWTPGAPANTATTIADVLMVLKATREELDKTDYALSRAAEMIVTPLSATSAMVDVHWRRDKKDGSVFQEGAEVLTLIKTEAGWRINGVIPRALSHYGKRF